MICHAKIPRERIRVWTRRIRLVRRSEFSDRMHEDRLAGFNQPPSTERANKPWIGFLPALHYPSIYWWHYVMVSIIQPWTWDRGLLWLTLSFFIYITAKPVGYIYPKEISINTVKFLYQTIAHLDSSSCRTHMHAIWEAPRAHAWPDYSVIYRSKLWVDRIWPKQVGISIDRSKLRVSGLSTIYSTHVFNTWML